MLKGSGVVLTREHEVLATLKEGVCGGGGGGERSFHPWKGGASIFTLSSEGAQQVSDLCFSHLVARPLPLLNDRSLRSTQRTS